MCHESCLTICVALAGRVCPQPPPLPSVEASWFQTTLFTSTCQRTTERTLCTSLLVARETYVLHRHLLYVLLCIWA